MARLDGTGPNGAGPMTGRGMGDCNTNNNGYYGRGQGLGRGAGRGIGRGFGIGYRNNSVQDDKTYLEAQKAELENNLKLINKELEELGK